MLIKLKFTYNVGILLIIWSLQLKVIFIETHSDKNLFLNMFLHDERRKEN